MLTRVHFWASLMTRVHFFALLIPSFFCPLNLSTLALPCLVPMHAETVLFCQPQGRT